VKERSQNNKSNLEKGKTKLLGPASVIWEQISEIWPKAGQPGGPAFRHPSLLHICDVIGELKVTLELQNRTQFSANGTKRGGTQKTRYEFAPQWTHENLPVRNTVVMERY